MNKSDEKKFYSQNGEDGIILKLIELLKIKDNGDLSSICGKFIKRVDSCLE